MCLRSSGVLRFKPGLGIRTRVNEPLEIPLLGRVAAGAPILAEEKIEGTIIVDGVLVRPGKHFALQVRGGAEKLRRLELSP